MLGGPNRAIAPSLPRSRRSVADRRRSRVDSSAARLGARLGGLLGGPAGDRAVAWLLFAAFVVVRLPFRAEILVNWDAVNYAFGVEGFDLRHHEPHPPGYLGYVLAGRMLAPLVGGPNAALTLLSVLTGAAVPAVLYVFARRFVARREALVVAVLLGTAPLLWYYSVVALSYQVGAALALGVAWACHVARVEVSERHLLAAAALLALLGAVRQTDLVFLLPLFGYAALAHGAAARVRAVAALGALCVVWLVPLLWLSGGPVAYLDLSSDLAALAGNRTWLLSLDLVGTAQNFLLVGAGVLLGVFAAVPLLMWTWRRGVGRRLVGAQRWFLWLWAGPALAAFLLVHTGQLGYVLLVLPPLYLVLAVRLAATREGLPAGEARPAGESGREQARGGGRRRLAAVAASPALVVSAVALAAVNVVGFVALPEASNAYAEATERPRDPSRAAILRRIREYDVGLNDAYWSAVRRGVERFDPDTTVLLARPSSEGSFRHLAFYLRDYRVEGVGHDREGDLGALFSARDGSTDYEVDGLSEADPVLRLPAGVRHVLTVEGLVQRDFDTDGLASVSWGLPGGGRMLHVVVPEGTTLRFDGDRSEGQIRVDPSGR